jgi:peptidoglycan/xylan/chitin deacetylase (PgdA/CDA1 family)
MSLRDAGRNLVIAITSATHLDTAERWRERHESRRRAVPFVRVLYMHATPRLHADRFRRQLAWLRRHFQVIDFAAFDRVMRGDHLESSRPAVLLTFDDGLVSNYEVAAPLLEEAGIRALFFVVPSFSVLGPDEARRFYRDRIRLTQGFEPSMTPQQIRDLAERGHTIGNHTFSHAKFARMPDIDLDREILDSATIIESWTGRRVDAFAWPFFWDSITPEAHQIAAGRHRYCFAPCAGRVDAFVDRPDLIWRTGIEPSMSPREFRFQCSALADRFSAERRRCLARRLRTIARPLRAAA